MTNRKLAAGAAGLVILAVTATSSLGATGDAPNRAVVKQDFSIVMKPNRYIKDKLRFDEDVYRVQSGGTLKVVLTAPQEGPHTVTVVRKRDLPTTAREAFNCRVCNKLFEAHGADPEGEEPPKFQFVENGVGQNNPPKFNRPGDSGLTPDRKGSSFTAKVTAKPGKTLHFLCLLHPWMQAKLVTE